MNTQAEQFSPTNPNGHPLVVGITGASGTVIGFRFIKELLQQCIPVELVMTDKGLQVSHDELKVKLAGNEATKAKAILNEIGLSEDYLPLLKVFGNHRLEAPPSSGTHLTRGMVIIPCSMGTLGRIAAGIGDVLVSRAADVTLKEDRPLILVPRESPLNQIHLKNLLAMSQAGAKIVPPMLTFYLEDFNSMDGQINYVLGKVFDLLKIPHTLHTRWGDHK
jgi:4-hydroxy-3-polyprenylbenzoate decarboxylase